MPFDLTYEAPSEEGLVFVLQGLHDTGAWWARTIEHEPIGCADNVCTVRFEIPSDWHCIYVIGKHIRPGDEAADPPLASEMSVASNMVNHGCLEGPPVAVPEVGFTLALIVGALGLAWLARKEVG